MCLKLTQQSLRRQLSLQGIDDWSSSSLAERYNSANFINPMWNTRATDRKLPSGQLAGRVVKQPPD